MFKFLAVMMLTGMSYVSSATEYITQDGTVRVVGNEPHTQVVFDNGKEVLEFSSMYSEGMRKFQGQHIKLNYFYVKKELKPSSFQRSMIGVVKVIPITLQKK